MSKFEKESIHRQDGGLPDLGLGYVDEHLSRQGKSVEDISNPDFRLFVLWTVIGQYRFSADLDRENNGDGLVLNDARYSQLLSTWTHEYRRVKPRNDICDASDQSSIGRVFEKLENKNILEAYDEVVNLRNEMPELIHPDERFDLYELIRTASKNSILEDLVLSDMIQETIPGGSGFCDNTERLRRYMILAKSDPIFFQIIDDYLDKDSSNLINTENSRYYEKSEENISDVCKLVADRGNTELANYIFDKQILNIDDEIKLFNAFI